MYDRIAAQVFNTPLLVEAARLDVVAAVVALRMGIQGVTAPEWDEKAPEMTVPEDAEFNADGGYYVTTDGIGIIGMMGTMIHRGGFMSSLSGLTSYTAIKKQFKHSMVNPAVKGVLLDANTPGGSAAGAFDTGDFIYQSRGTKPVYSIAEDMMTSAGYLLGSPVDRVYTTQTGRVGSIGVVMQHMDFSKMNEKRGLAPTYIYAGDQKIDGAPDLPLSPEAHARFQEDINQLYNMFVAAIDRNRSNLSTDVIRDTQAGVYMGQQAVDIGLVDEVANIEEVLDQMRSDIKGAGSRHISTIGMEDTTMPAEANQGEQDKQLSTDTKTGSSISEPDAKATQAKKAETATANGASAERARIKTIMSSDHATGRKEQAEHLAYSTEMSAEAAIDVLKAGASSVKPAGKKLDDAMAKTKQPGIGAEGGQAEVNDVDRLCSNFAMASGQKKGIK